MHSLYVNTFYQDTCLQRINFEEKNNKKIGCNKEKTINICLQLKIIAL